MTDEARMVKGRFHRVGRAKLGLWSCEDDGTVTDDPCRHLAAHHVAGGDRSVSLQTPRWWSRHPVTETFSIEVVPAESMRAGHIGRHNPSGP